MNLKSFKRFYLYFLFALGFGISKGATEMESLEINIHIEKENYNKHFWKEETNFQFFILPILSFKILFFSLFTNLNFPFSLIDHSSLHANTHIHYMHDV